MNNMSLTIFSIMVYNVMVRETLEYTIPKDKYSLEMYNNRKKHILGEIENSTALKLFFDNNKEKAKPIEDRIRALYSAIYADDSTICKVANNELRVDASQHLAVFDAVFELHEDIKKIVDGNLGFARSQGLLEDELFKLVVADERFYRAIAFQCLYRDLENLFYEFNKARNDAKGEITPQSNFIQGELQRIVKHIYFVRDHQSLTDNKYWDVVDYVIKTVDWTSGKRQLPEGKKFNECFQEGHRILDEFLTSAQNEWTPLYQAAFKELIEVSQKNNGKIEVNIKPKN